MHVLSIEQLKPIYERNGRNAQRTADELGVAASTLKSWPAYREVRSPFIVTGRTTLTNLQTGEQVLQWEREALDRQQDEEARQAAYDAMADKLPRAVPTSVPTAVNADLCNLYTFTDYHLGCLAWREE